MTEALASDFEAAFREAYDRYARDNNSEDPNEAPKACWPSAREFRNILFKAGQHQGLAAEKYLNRILDPDLRLFAQIELCATVEGVPQIGGCIVTQRSKMQSCSFCSPGEPEEIFGPVIRVFVVPNVSGRRARKTFGPAVWASLEYIRHLRTLPKMRLPAGRNGVWPVWRNVATRGMA